jgi:hypothetical protein
MTGRAVGLLLIGLLASAGNVLPAQSLAFLDRSGRDTVAIELVEVTPIQIRGVRLERGVDGKRETRYAIGIGPNGGMTRIDLTVMAWDPSTGAASLPLRIAARTVADTMRVERRQGEARVVPAHAAVAGRPIVPVIGGSRVARLMLRRILANDSVTTLLVVATGPTVTIDATPVRRSGNTVGLVLAGESVAVARSGLSAQLAGQISVPPHSVAVQSWWTR